MSQQRILILLAALALILSSPAADARGGGGFGGFGGGRATGDFGRSNSPFGRGDNMRDNIRAMQNRDAVGRPADRHGRAIDHDDHGAAIMRGAIVAVSPAEADLAAARRLNFAIGRRDRLSALGLTAVTLEIPPGLTAVQALAALRAAAPGGTFDYVHIYDPMGAGGLAAAPTAPPVFIDSYHVVVGMIDGGAWKDHRALRRARIRSRVFIRGSHTPPTVHGTAVASLLVGRDREFSGYLPGARLYAADVFGGAADGGSADAIARALDWLADNKVPVSNISLAGPPNALLAAAVRSFVGQGHVLVAAAGNNGPAAPPNYPAAYPGVIAVTAIDAARRIAFDANRIRSGFAAPGVKVRAATLPDGYAAFSGTSYAAPAVTAGFARLLAKPDPIRARAAFDRLANASLRLDGAGHLFLLDPALFAVTVQ